MSTCPWQTELLFFVASDKSLHCLLRCTIFWDFYWQVQLNGCHRVTETGLYQLIKLCKNLQGIQLKGTSVSILPKDIINYIVTLDGCPLISPEREIFNKGGFKVLKGGLRVYMNSIYTSSWENLFMSYANNKGADQPAHPHSFFTACIV